MLVGKSSCAIDASWRRAIPQGSKAGIPGRFSRGGFRRSGETGFGAHPKISVIQAVVTNSQAIKVTKWSTFAGDLDVSEQESNQVSDNLGDVVGAGPTVSSSSEATPGSAKDPASVESPKLAPEQGGADKAKDAPKIDAPKVERQAEDRRDGRCAGISRQDHGDVARSCLERRARRARISHPKASRDCSASAGSQHSQR